MAQLILEILLLTTASVFVGTLTGGLAAHRFQLVPFAAALTAGRTPPVAAPRAKAPAPAQSTAASAAPAPRPPEVAPYLLPPPLAWLGTAPPRDEEALPALPPPLAWLGTPFPASPAAETPPAAIALQDGPEDVIDLPPVLASATAEPAPAGEAPPALSGPIDGAPDDLKRLKGIGAQTEARLNGFGIYHFAQIAAFTPDNIAWLNNRLGAIGRADRMNWPSAAQALLDQGPTGAMQTTSPSQTTSAPQTEET